MASVVLPPYSISNCRGTKRKRRTSVISEASTLFQNFSPKPLVTSPYESTSSEYSESDGTESDDVHTNSMDFDETKAGHKTKASATPMLVNGQLVDPHKVKNKKYMCTHDGCMKAYTKPARLEEHLRSHTGERPFVCTFDGCGKAYLRDSHLQAHARSHQPYSARPYVCDEAGCEKKFWTSTQLNVHSRTHSGVSKTLKCPDPSCIEAFAKNHQVRSHFALVHCTPGTKKFICEHEGCDKSFSTSQKIKAHAKVHQADRYICTDKECIAAGSQYFQTWTLLQAHIRIVHPPTCSDCGKTFSSQKNFKAHLKVHEDRATQEALLGDQFNRDIKANEVGRDWKCDWGSCPKSFKSRKAKTVHVNVNHLGQRNFVCEREGCGKAFGYKHLLQRHCAKLHGIHSDDARSDKEGAMDKESNVEPSPVRDESFIEVLTGRAYKRRKLEPDSMASHKEVRSRKSKKGKRVLRCPWPQFGDVMDVVGESNHKQHTACDAIFNRAYDLRRHLKADHGLEVTKEEVAAWVE